MNLRPCGKQKPPALVGVVGGPETTPHPPKTIVRRTHLGHSRHEIPSGSRLELANNGVRRQSSHASDALQVLVGEVGLALLLPLGQGHIQRLGSHNAPIHLSYGFGGFFWRGEADEAEAFASTIFQHHLMKGRD